MFQFAMQNERSLLPPGEGHDCMDAGGRATPGAVAEDEGVFMGNFMITLTPSLSRKERESSSKASGKTYLTGY